MTDAPPPTPTPPAPAAGRSRGRRAVRAATWSVLGLFAVLALVAGGLATLWHSEAGTRWALARVPALTVTGVQGSLGGGDLRIAHIHVAAGALRVEIDDARLQGLSLRWRPGHGLWVAARADRLSATRATVAWQSTTPAGAPAKPPASLRTAATFEVPRFEVGTLSVAGLPAFSDVHAGLVLGGEDGTQYRIDTLGFSWERLQAQAQARLDGAGPVALEAHVSAHNAAALSDTPPDLFADPAQLPWTATASLSGPLADLATQFALRGVPRPGHDAPQVDARARLQPFAAFPLADVALQTRAFDLASLSASAPSTRLEGTIALSSARPVAARVDLRNLAPARWSDGGLPIARLAGRLEAPWSADPLTVPDVEVAFDDGHGAAGSMTASGRWSRGTASAKLALQDVALARLDARLAAVTVGGTVALDADGLAGGGAAAPSAGVPAPAAGGRASSPPAARASRGPAPAASALLVGPRGVTALPPGTSASAAAAVADAAATPSRPVPVAPAKPWRLHVVADLHGPLSVPGSPVTRAATLSLDARLRPDHVEVSRAELASGDTHASVKGRLDRGGADEGWHGDASATWKAFEPAMWWRSGTAVAKAAPKGAKAAAAPASAPALAPREALLHDTRLDGTLDVQLARLPTQGAGWAGLRGRASASLTGSRVAGTPVEGRATLVAEGDPWQSTGDLSSGHGSVHWQASASPAARGPADRLQATLDAPQVADLAPIAGLVPGLAAHWPRRGQVNVALDAGGTHLLATAAGARRGDLLDGLVVETHGEAADLAMPDASLAHARWQLHAGTSPGAAWEGLVALDDLHAGAAQVDAAQLQVTGTAARHTLQLAATAPLQPPAWVAQLARLTPGARNHVDATVEGRWGEDVDLAGLPAVPGEPPGGRATGPRWRAHVASLAMREAGPAPRGAARPASAPAPAAERVPWLELRPADLALTFSPAGAPRTLRLSPGGLSLAGLQVDWDPAWWAAGDGPAPSRWRVAGRLAPVAVAPLLARAQPDLGWRGDLAVAAQWELAFDGAWHVSAEVHRTAGDLSVSETLKDAALPSQALGLTEVTAGITGEAGLWRVHAASAGRHVGHVALDVSARTAPDALPSTASPMNGTLHADVADLGAWGAWLPPGWRLGGTARADVTLGGRLGTPDLSGQLTASQLEVRNSLQGVHGRDGEVSIRLAGDRATIERFLLHAGTGTLTATGGATLGASPTARIDLEARQFQALGRLDRRLVASGHARIDLGPDAAGVAGALRIDEALFDLSRGNAPTLDADVQVQGEGDEEGSAAPGGEATGGRAGRTTRLAVTIDLGDRLQVRGRGVDTRLAGQVQLSAPQGRLAVRGMVRAVDGQYTAYGQKLDIQRGEITFTGPLEDPALDIRAVRKNIDIVVGVAITGTALQPRVRLFSEPEMADIDKLSWLMLGRAPETLGRADTALLQSAALALFAGEGESPSESLLRRIGLTDFSVRQENTGDVHDTIVGLGRQLSKRWYVGYERSINNATGNWQLVYRIAQRVTVRAQSGADTSLDVIWTWRWN